MSGYSYLSLESALAENKPTPPYGIIEFTHTNRSEQEIINHTTKLTNRPLRLANVATAYTNLKNVGRNLNMVNETLYTELINKELINSH